MVRRLVQVASLGLALLGTSCASQASGPVVGDQQSSDEMYPAVLDHVMAISGTPELLDSRIEWRAVARIVTPGMAERHMTLSVPFGGGTGIQATGLQPVDTTLARQLEDLVRQFPLDTPARLAERARVQRRIVSATDCPQLLTVANQLSGVNVKAVPSSDIVLDAPTYDVVVTTRSERNSFQTIGRLSPVAAWADALERALFEQCTAEK